MTDARIVFLGTGGALNEERSQVSMLIEAGATRVLLDAGGGLGVVRCLLAAGCDTTTLGHVFLSHRHLDHVGGLEPLLLWIALHTRAARAPLRDLRLYASPETAAAVGATLAAADAAGERRFGDRLAWRTPSPDTRLALDDGAGIVLVPVDHLPPGGGAAGCVVDAGGVRVAYSGDTRPWTAFADVARGVDLLVHEVGGLDARAETVHAVGHSTAGDAGRIAARAGARALALTHLPASRWVSADDLLAEARRFAPDVEVFVAEDGAVRKL
jgi:ribonuclease Z